MWEHTLSFFPQFLATLGEHASPGASVAVVGASDGKFVLPLAAAGYRVIAIERDPLALHGGQVRLPGDIAAQAPGLIARLEREGLRDWVQVVEGDFLTTAPSLAPCDAIWTSCSWHYSVNHRCPLAEFIAHMQRLIRPNGLFGAEFMMPIEEKHFLIEHYTSPERLSRHFTEGWTVLLKLRTSEFGEHAHVGQLQDHVHRMGLLLALRDPRRPSHESGE
ncbi:MAG: class I SAM-dependent methyltransferase [Streptosporangiaceae bacterium]